VFKRTWIMVITALVLVVLMSACKGGDLAKDLTPIPTLPPGAEPTLINSLQSGTGAQTGSTMSQDQLVTLGEQLFVPCQSCHGSQDSIGPAFVGMGERATTRVEGMAAEAYLRESIVNPSAFVVPDFKDNIMPKSYGQSFSDDELNALVTYILAKSGGETAAVVEPTPEPTQAEAPTAEPTVEAATEEPTQEAQPTEPAAPVGDAAAGKTLFTSCAGCHGDTDGAGPARVGMGKRAATRIEGMSAADYLHQSIVEPDAFVVDGFTNIMPATFGETMSDQEISDLIAYLLTQ
jgi:mono/diheme cytochrome c family protein